MQTFVSCFIGAQDKQGGLHSDESTHPEFHYSCVLYLSSQQQDFTGGTFMWNDPPAEGEAGGERTISPMGPSRGSAIIFSSGTRRVLAPDASLSACPPAPTPSSDSQAPAATPSNRPRRAR